MLSTTFLVYSNLPLLNAFHKFLHALLASYSLAQGVDNLWNDSVLGSSPQHGILLSGRIEGMSVVFETYFYGVPENIEVSLPTQFCERY
jgi:hypothetical protein